MSLSWYNLKKLMPTFKYRWSLFLFILVIVSSLKCMPVEDLSILLMVCNTSIVKNLSVGEFWRFMVTLTLLNEILSAWYTVVSCIKELMMINRSSRPKVFCEKGVLRNFVKFTGKYLCQSLFFNKASGLQLYLNEFQAQVFSCEFCEISKNTYRTPPVAPSG